MIKFKLNGKQIDIPSTWDDLSMVDYCEVTKKDGDILKLVCTRSGMNYENFKKSTIIGLEEVIMAMSFIRTTPKLPDSVTEIGGYKIPVNKDGGFNIQFESLAQFEDMRAVIRRYDINKPEQVSEAFINYVTIYLQKIRDGEYDHEKAKAMHDEVRHMPALKVIALGSFFTIKLLNLLTGSVPSFPHTNQTPKKSKQATTGSRKPSAYTARSRKRR